jgi:hypothetical protein
VNADQAGQPQAGSGKNCRTFRGRALIKAIPFVGIATPHRANILMTYIIGRRDDIFASGQRRWAIGETVYAVTGVDERAGAGSAT